MDGFKLLEHVGLELDLPVISASLLPCAATVNCSVQTQYISPGPEMLAASEHKNYECLSAPSYTESLQQQGSVQPPAAAASLYSSLKACASSADQLVRGSCRHTRPWQHECQHSGSDTSITAQ